MGNESGSGLCKAICPPDIISVAAIEIDQFSLSPESDEKFSKKEKFLPRTNFFQFVSRIELKISPFTSSFTD